jgi:opacity protein-like surface antigen
MKNRILPAAFLFVTLRLSAAEPTVSQEAQFQTIGSGWEWSLGAQLREFSVDWNARSWPDYEATSWNGQEDSAAFGGVLQFGKELSNNSSTVVRLEFGYGFSHSDFHSGEVTVGDTEEELYTLDISKLNVSVHQIHAGLSISKKIGNKLELGLAFGPSIALINADFDATQEVFEEIREDVGAYRDGRGLSQSDTSAVFGVYGEARARYHVNQNVFLEASAGYHWMDSKSYGNSDFGAKLDPKSFTVGVKIGFKF